MADTDMLFPAFERPSYSIVSTVLEIATLNITLCKLAETEMLFPSLSKVDKWRAIPLLSNFIMP